MDLSNKALGLLLVAAIVISIGGTIVSLNRLDGLSTTGFATQQSSGNVTINIPELLSITLTDSTINFGSCSINTSRGYSFLDSAFDNLTYNNADCDGTDNFPDHLVLENNGNRFANITVRTDANISVLFGDIAEDEGSFIAYNVTNGTSPGCIGVTPGSYTNFTELTPFDYPVCSNFTFAEGIDELNITIQANLTAGSVAGGTMNLTFVAQEP